MATTRSSTQAETERAECEVLRLLESAGRPLATQEMLDRLGAAVSRPAARRAIWKLADENRVVITPDWRISRAANESHELETSAPLEG